MQRELLELLEVSLKEMVASKTWEGLMEGRRLYLPKVSVDKRFQSLTEPISHLGFMDVLW